MRKEREKWMAEKKKKNVIKRNCVVPCCLVEMQRIYFISKLRWRDKWSFSFQAISQQGHIKLTFLKAKRFNIHWMWQNTTYHDSRHEENTVVCLPLVFWSDKSIFLADITNSLVVSTRRAHTEPHITILSDTQWVVRKRHAFNVSWGRENVNSVLSKQKKAKSLSLENVRWETWMTSKVQQPHRKQCTHSHLIVKAMCMANLCIIDWVRLTT